MVYLRDLWDYVWRIVTHDSWQKSILVLSVAQLAANYYYENVLHKSLAVSTVGSLLIFGFIVIIAGFRVWRDDRKMMPEEVTQLREIASVVRVSVGELDSQKYRSPRYSNDGTTAKVRESRFLAHFPKLAQTIREWCESPQKLYEYQSLLQEKVLLAVPSFIQNDAKLYTSEQIIQFVAETLDYEAPPEPRFRLSEDGSRLNWGGGTINVIDDVTATKVEQVSIMNEWALQMWTSQRAEKWRDKKREVSVLKQKLLDDLEDIQTKTLTRQHCTTGCYRLSSGD